jgi:L-threonylcarbamoyladenylate synthase
MVKTRIIKLENPSAPTSADREALREAGEIIQKGGLVAFPTETVYGLGGDALNPASSKAIYAAKGRPSDNPLIVHIADLQDAGRVADMSRPEAMLLAKRFWPGPMTLVLPALDTVPRETTGGLDTVAVRMPSDPTAAELIRRAGGFVAAPSANLSGRPSPTDAEHVIQDLEGRVDAIIDGGDNPIGLESTIVDLTVEDPMILRPGYITPEMLSEALGKKVELDPAILSMAADAKPKAPGMKYRHYAPKGSLTIVKGNPKTVVAKINELLADAAKAGKKTGVIATKELALGYKADVIYCIGSAGDEAEVGHNLYRILRKMDDEGVEVICSEAFADSGFGKAVMNRLRKAAGGEMIEVS